MATDNIQPKIQEILIKGKESKKDRARCETFFYQPENIEEMKLGSLFIVAKIESSSEATHIINLLPSLIKREYYFNQRRKPLASFEASLKKANSALTELTKKGNLEWLNKIDLLCASINKNQLLFTSIGQTKAFLLRGNRLTDISKKLVPAQEKINPRKPFQSVASGKLFANDKIILTTADIFKYIPQKGLKQILESGQIDQLKTIIQENKNITSQGLVIIELVPGQEITLKQPETITFSELPAALTPPLSSTSNLKKRFRISPEFEETFSNLALFIRSLFFKLSDNWQLRTKKFHSAPVLIPKISLDGPLPLPLKKNLSDSQSSNRKPSIRKNLEKKPFFDPLVNLFPSLPKISRLFLPAFEKISSNFKTQTPQHRKIFLGMLIIIILSSISFRYFLSQKYQKEIKNNNELTEQYQVKLDQRNKITRLENLSPLLSVPQNNFGFIADQLSITEENLIITTKQKTNIFFSLPLVEPIKTGNFIPTDLPKDKNWLQAAAYKNNLVLIEENNDIYKYDFANKTSSRLNLAIPSSSSLQGVVIFNNNLYLLDPAANQIIKCPQLENCQNWLQGKNNLSSALSLAIDSSVFILYPNGAIAKYLSGAEQNIIKPTIKPPSNGFEKIITGYGFKNIYLLDKEQKRIIIIDKKGNLIKQYFSPIFENIKDIQISPDEKIIYILSEDKIYKIEI